MEHWVFWGCFGFSRGILGIFVRVPGCSGFSRRCSGVFRGVPVFRCSGVPGITTCPLSEHANETGHLPTWKEVKFIDRDPHWYTRTVKKSIHIRLHPNNINRDSGIEILEAWIPTIRKHNSRPTTKRTCEGTTSNSRNNNEDRNAPIAANHHATNSET